MVNDKRLLTRVQFFVLALILGNPINAVAAEETTLLTIQGNLIERLELLAENSSATMIISNYYNLLPDQARNDIESRRTRLEQLQPNYDVAYLAADSAEMAEVREKIDEQWTIIHSIHEHFFTSQVVEILNQAYIENFNGLLPEA